MSWVLVGFNNRFKSEVIYKCANCRICFGFAL